ncbi:MAG: hypothetical protein ACFCVD_17945 [Nodosilinea sp.]
MSAALKSYVPRPLRPQSTAAEAEPLPFQPQSLTPAPDQGAGVERLGQLRSLPTPTPSRTLATLTNFHLVSSVLATALVGLALASYGASVYVDRQLSQATQRLNQLQRSEQQLTTVNEVLKSHMAEQAEAPDTALQPPTPGNVIFLQPAPGQPMAPAVRSPSRRFPWPGVDAPLGY